MELEAGQPLRLLPSPAGRGEDACKGGGEEGDPRRRPWLGSLCIGALIIAVFCAVGAGEQTSSAVPVKAEGHEAVLAECAVNFAGKGGIPFRVAVIQPEGTSGLPQKVIIYDA